MKQFAFRCFSSSFAPPLLSRRGSYGKINMVDFASVKSENAPRRGAFSFTRIFIAQIPCLPYNKRMIGSENALTVEKAAELLGYQSKEALKRRIRNLRAMGRVQDHGSPPDIYKNNKSSAGISLFWINPKLYLIMKDSALFIDGYFYGSEESKNE